MAIKNVIVLSGTPHANGNTAALLKAFLKGLKKGKKLSVEIVETYRLKVAPVLEAEFTGKKAKADDADTLLPKMLAADLIVLASPLYFWGISAQLKKVWERLYGTDYAKLKGKTLAIIATGGGEDKKDSGADLVETQFKNICAYTGMRFKGLTFACSDPAPVAKNKKALALAEKAGAKIK